MRREMMRMIVLRFLYGKELRRGDDDGISL